MNDLGSGFFSFWSTGGIFCWPFQTYTSFSFSFYQFLCVLEGWLFLCDSWTWLRAWQELSCVTHAFEGLFSSVSSPRRCLVRRNYWNWHVKPLRVPLCHYVDPVFHAGRSAFHCTSQFHPYPHLQRHLKSIFKLDKHSGLKVPDLLL